MEPEFYEDFKMLVAFADVSPLRTTSTNVLITIAMLFPTPFTQNTTSERLAGRNERRQIINLHHQHIVIMISYGKL